MTKRPSGIAILFGLLNIVFAVLGIFGGSLPLFKHTAGFLGYPAYLLGDYRLAVSYMSICLVLFVCGIGLFLMKEIARQVSLVCACALIVLEVLTWLYNATVILPPLKDVDISGFPSRGFYISIAIPCCWDTLYALALLIVLNIPSVVSSFALQALDPNQRTTWLDKLDTQASDRPFLFNAVASVCFLWGFLSTAGYFCCCSSLAGHAGLVNPENDSLAETFYFYPAYRPYLAVNLFADVICSVLLLASGWGMWKLRRWSWWGLLGYSLLSLLQQVVSLKILLAMTLNDRAVFKGSRAITTFEMNIVRSHINSRVVNFDAFFCSVFPLILLVLIFFPQIWRTFKGARASGGPYPSETNTTSENGATA